ncbi:Hpt domain-containing protein [Butyrivibrio sp. LC3010]|uniref:Hpt domain-containing protein n=1 Tax=Butyrivibrio sp. LC3010 TaxID=1280680 RepID=UPI00040CAFAF|nr:Hpt domain-containing protein [Butyrivibrio sp. LC3010]
MCETEFDYLKKIDGISLTDGLNFCGTKKAFLKFLNTFYSNIDSKSDEIEKAYKSGDFSFYTTKVHALKSTARIIGAFELSELALMLEEAGRNGDEKCIDDNTCKLLELFRSYKNKLSVLDSKRKGDNEIKKEISPEKLEDAYSALREVIPTMDYDSVEMILDELKVYKLSTEDFNIITQLEKLLRNFKWDEMDVLIGQSGR